MKKTLSVVLTSAMALSMFSSVAFGKTSADFTDLKDLDAATKVKFDAMITAGIFDGVTETTFGLKDEMNRAQFAKVAALIMGLEVNKDLKTSTFTDVSVTDAANGYALPYIEALKTAGVTDGYAEGQYNPAGKVTKEQLATFLVRVLGQDAAAKGKTGTDTTVSGWAQGYVALALELKLLANGSDGKFGGMTNATRDLLVTGAYEAKQQYVPAGKVSVTGAKATGVKQVTVSFNKPVDTEKATFELKKGTASVTLTDAKATWSADKKTATLTLKDTKVSEGKYTATVSGLDAAAVEKASAEFEATDEKVNKIEFVNATDTVAYGKKVGIKIKASNQYGENASISAGNYTVFTGNVTNSLKKNDDGTLVLTLNVNDGSNGLIQGNSVVPVNIFNNDSRVSADKTFKVGIAPYATKLELGEVVYSNSNKVISSVGETATINLYQYDQYGNIIAEEDTGSVSNIPNVIVTPYEKALVATEKKFDKVVFGLTEKSSTSGDFNVTVYAGASSATTKIAVKSSEFAKKIEFGDFSGTLAAGDGEKFLPINVYDEEGNKLTADEVINNANIINVNSSIGNATLQTSGEHKGEIRIANIDAGLANGYINVSASIV
ncbi:S-layer homology domain-containing protein, partial [Paenibacillus sp. Soil724D2]|uniref:S-layer homology domain-containing protein n=1 Tax=Paenibacillus sp. (strain Soil724D2) TaxID=1736392 RepID=UPI00138EDA04